MEKMKQTKKKIEIENLHIAINNLHNCQSKWLESVAVKETFEGETVWEGIVQVFELIDHPTAKKCYAWSYVMDDSGKRKIIAVLHQDPVKSPVDAVKAFIVSEYK